MPSFYKVQEDYGGMQNLLEGRSKMETMGESEKLHFARSVAKDLAECSSPSSIKRSNFILNKLLIVCVGQPCEKTLFTEGMSHNIRFSNNYILEPVSYIFSKAGGVHFHTIVKLKKCWVRWDGVRKDTTCLLYTSPSPRDATLSRMPSSA